MHLSVLYLVLLSNVAPLTLERNHCLKGLDNYQPVTYVEECMWYRRVILEDPCGEWNLEIFDQGKDGIVDEALITPTNLEDKCSVDGGLIFLIPDKIHQEVYNRAVERERNLRPAI